MRQALAQILRDFGERYGEHLHRGSWSDCPKAVRYSQAAFQRSVAFAEEAILHNAVEFTWSSADDPDHWSTFQINA